MSMIAGTPILPYDILDEIIDIFAETYGVEEVKTLSSLSRFFRDQCRKHIFGVIRIGNERVLMDEDEDVEDDEDDDEDDEDDEDHGDHGDHGHDHDVDENENENVDDGDDEGEDPFEEGVADDEQTHLEKDDKDIEDSFGIDVLATSRRPLILHSIPRFVNLVHRFPDVAHYIRCLRIIYPHNADRCLSATTVTKLTKLTMVQISVEYGELWPNFLSDALLALSDVPSFQTLRIDRAKCFPVSLLGRLPGLQHLQLVGVQLVRDIDETPWNIDTPPPKLKTLAISAVNLALFKDLHRNDGKPILDLSGLTTLQFDVVSGPQPVTTISDFLKDQPTQIQSVEKLSFELLRDYVENGPSDHSEFIQQHVDGWVLPHHNLRTLEVRVCITPHTRDPYSGLCATLDKLEPNNNLIALNITVYLSVIHSEKDVEWGIGGKWRALTTVLSKSGWKNLESLFIIVIFDGVLPEWPDRPKLYDMYSLDL